MRLAVRFRSDPEKVVALEVQEAETDTDDHGIITISDGRGLRLLVPADVLHSVIAEDGDEPDE